MEPLEVFTPKTHHDAPISLQVLDSTRSRLDSLVKVSKKIGAKGWCPATSGNFSVRTSARSFLVSSSGLDKSELSSESFLEIVDGKSVENLRKPSAETMLHTWIYEHFPKAECVLHTHSMASTLLSSWVRQRALFISDLELLKAMNGFDTHAATLRIPIVNNSQDMKDITKELDVLIAEDQLQNVFLIRGHGLYTWGSSVKDAERHLECLEFLLNTYWELSKLETSSRFYS